jgi:hypothetical protein
MRKQKVTKKSQPQPQITIEEVAGPLSEINQHTDEIVLPLGVEEQNIVFRPNPGPQSAFLAAADREVLYGGAAGGGKSYAMLADPLRYMGHPQFSGLLLRHTTEELRELIWKSQEMYPKIYPGIKWSERKMQWVTPQGARLWFHT